MTTIRAKLVRCIHCGWRGKKSVMMSTSSWGPAGLDLRPAPPAGQSVALWVMDCPRCGYCARDISQPVAIGDVAAFKGGWLRDELDRRGPWRQALKKLMATPQYGHPFGITDPMPNPVIAHLRHAVLQQVGGHWAEAGRSALCAAWLCDDHASRPADDHMAAAGARCRSVAIGLFEEARKASQPYASDPINEELVMIDLLRRIGDFARASQRLANLPPELNEDDRAIAIRQQGWIALKDRAAHHAQEDPPDTSS